MIFNKNKTNDELVTKVTNSLETLKKEIIDSLVNTEAEINSRLDFKYDYLEKIEASEKRISTLGKKISNLETEINLKDEFIEKQFQIIDKLVGITEKNNIKLLEKIEELKKQVPVKLRPTKSTKQVIGIKSGAKTSKIIKKVKEI